MLQRRGRKRVMERPWKARLEAAAVHADYHLSQAETLRGRL
jgi:hypothetical protein